jgi:predicted nuclease with TOPRIM domain
MDINDIPLEGLGGGAIGAAGLWLIAKKVMLKTAIDSAEKMTVDAQALIFENLHKELERMMKSNGEIIAELHATRADNLRLHNDNARLHNDNQLLRQEVTLLRSSLDDLNEQLAAINKMRVKCGGCDYNEKEKIYVRKLDLEQHQRRRDDIV